MLFTECMCSNQEVLRFIVKNLSFKYSSYSMLPPSVMAYLRVVHDGSDVEIAVMVDQLQSLILSLVRLGLPSRVPDRFPDLAGR